jgi:Flp pilus assembly protein TadG
MKKKKAGAKLAAEQVKYCAENENGSIIIIVAVAMVALLGMAALAIDLGMVYLKAGQLQKAIDAAAYSAGRMLPVDTSNTEAQNQIKDTAISYASLNGYDNLTRSDIVLDGVFLGNYTNMRIEASQDYSTVFAPVLGIDSLSFTKRAMVKLSPINSTTGVAPLGLTKTELKDRLLSGDLEHVILKYGKKDGSLSSFGALDLSGKGGASDYRLWLAQGYPGEISIGDILIEESGNMTGPTYQGFSARYNACTHYDAQSGGSGCISGRYDISCPRIIKVVIYEPEAKKSVRVCGFAAFLLENQTNNGYITGTFLNIISDGTPSGEDLSNDSFYGISGLVLAE